MIQKLYLHFKLFWNIKKYLNSFLENKKHDINHLKTITDMVTDCGPVAIKFCQWITPKLELIYLDNNEIISDKKPDWLSHLERFYENCDNHSDEYTIQEYKRIFKTDLTDNYEILEIIGSGSIGQVYVLKDKITNEKCAMKILHPGVKENIIFFRRFLKFLLLFPCIKSIRNQYLPFDIFEFIEQFEEQTNLINEFNHILYFYKEYQTNEFIIVPYPIKISESILLMTYEEGVSFDDCDLNEYQKEKIINLYHLFVRNNNLILNYNHGDLHPGNWKIKKCNDTNNHKLIIYDFGYCWRISFQKFNEIGTLFVDTFEESNRKNNTVSIEKLCKITNYLILYDDKSEEIKYKNKIHKFIVNEIDNLEPWKLSPLILLKTAIKFCIQESLLLEPIIIQSFILVIQGQKLFEKYGLMASDKRYISDYEVFRDRYLNILTFCKTYTIFTKYSKHIEEKLNDKQLSIDSIFDTITLDESIKKLALQQ